MTFEPEALAGMVEVWVADDIALADAAAVSSWQGRIAASDASQSTATKQPLYRTAGNINSQPAVDFDGTNDFLRYPGSLSTASSGWVFAVVNILSFTNSGGDSERAVWSSSDQATNSHNLHGLIRVSAAKVRANWTEGANTDAVQGNTVLDTTTPYLIEWDSSGTAWSMRVNGVVQTLTTAAGSNHGNWFGDVTARDNFCIGARKQTDERIFFYGQICVVGVADGVTASGTRNDLYGQVNTKYGTSLPYSTPSGPPFSPVTHRPNLRAYR